MEMVLVLALVPGRELVPASVPVQGQAPVLGLGLAQHRLLPGRLKGLLSSRAITVSLS